MNCNLSVLYSLPMEMWNSFKFYSSEFSHFRRKARNVQMLFCESPPGRTSEEFEYIFLILRRFWSNLLKVWNVFFPYPVSDVVNNRNGAKQPLFTQ